MRSDHLSKHIKTHSNKKTAAAATSNTTGTTDASSPVVVTKSETGAVSANDQHAFPMDTISTESIARLANSGINMMQVDLHQMNGSGF